MRRILLKNGTHLSIPSHTIIRVFATDEPKWLKLKTHIGDFIVDGDDFLGSIIEDLYE